MFTKIYNKLEALILQSLGADLILSLFVLSVLGSIIYFVGISYLVTRLDKHYFVDRSLRARKTPTKSSRLVIIKSSRKLMLNMVKMLIGGFTVFCGLLMLFLPGQGVITILIGLSLLPFPGKQALERYLLSLQTVRSTLNWMRIKAKKEPFIFEKES